MTFQNPFYFLRHGETTWNHARRTQGQLDTPLNETGIAQAQQAGIFLADEPLERIVASPLSRARHTAEAVAIYHDIEIEFDEDLKECHLGDMQGEPHGPWLREYWTGDFDPPNGETFEVFAARVWNCMEKIVNQSPNTLIVAHGGLWIAAHSYTSVKPDLLPMPNAQPLLVTPKNGVWNHGMIGAAQ